MDLKKIYNEILLSEYPEGVDKCKNWLDNNEQFVEECNHMKVKYCMVIGFLFGDFKMMADSMKLYKEVITDICENPDKIKVREINKTIIRDGNEEAFRLCMENFRLFQLDYDFLLNLCIKTMVQAKTLFNKIEKNKQNKEMTMMSQEDININN